MFFVSRKDKSSDWFMSEFMFVEEFKEKLLKFEKIHEKVHYAFRLLNFRNFLKFYKKPKLLMII